MTGGGSSGVVAALVECGGCGGVWLAPGALDRLCASAEAMQDASQHLFGRAAPRRLVDPSKVAYLPCPTCKDRMVRRNFGGASGVIVDVCKEHGVWLDHGELEKVVEFSRAGGLEKARQNEVERLEREAKEARERRDAPHDFRDRTEERCELRLSDLFADLYRLFRKKP